MSSHAHHRVLYLLRYYPTLSETFVYEEIRELRRQGHEVTIASLGAREDGRGHPDHPTPDRLTIPRRPLVGKLSPASTGGRFLREHQRPKDAARLPWIRQKAASFDRIHVHFAGEAAEFAHAIWLDRKIPYSVTVHASDLFKPRPSLATVLKSAAAVLTISEYNQIALRKLGLDAQVVHCGPRLADWDLAPAPPGPLSVLSVGRNVPKKGFDLLLQAWESSKVANREGTLTIIGDLKKTNLPSGVRVLGPCSPQDVRQAMEAANLFVLACRRAPDGDMDGIPLAIMEALAASRAVISTRISGIPELINDEVGWLVSPDQVEEFAKTLNEAENTRTRTEKGKKGTNRLMSRQFTLKHQVEGLISTWIDT